MLSMPGALSCSLTALVSTANSIGMIRGKSLLAKKKRAIARARGSVTFRDPSGARVHLIAGLALGRLRCAFFPALAIPEWGPLLLVAPPLPPLWIEHSITSGRLRRVVLVWSDSELCAEQALAHS